MNKFNIIYSESTHIAGIRYKSSDGRSRRYYVKKLQPREKLLLLREPDNPKDKKAVKILNTDGKLLGYLPRGDARTIAGYMDEGEKTAAVVKNIDYKLGVSCRCDIKVVVSREKNSDY